MVAEPAGDLSPERVAKLESDLAYRVREVETLNSDVAELTTALAARAKEIESLNADVADLARALEARGAEVERLHADIECRGAEAEELHAGLRDRDDEVRDLNEQVARLSAGLRTRGGEVEDLARAVDARTRQAEELERAVFAAAEPGSGGPASPAVPAPGPGRLPASPWPARATPTLDLAGVAWTLVRTDFKIRYHGTVGGFLWALAKPLAMITVLASVFAWLFAATPDYRLQLLVGIILWDFFAEGSKTGLLSLLAKAHLLGKTAFPRWILVATSLATPLLTLAVFCTGLFAVLVAAGRLPGPGPLAAFAAGLLALITIVLGLSFAASVVVLRYRDLNQVWEVVLQAGFFLAPVVYPLSAVPEPLRPWLMLWPPTAVVEFARTAIVRGVVPEPAAGLPLLVMALLALGLGLALYRRHGPVAAEYL